MVEGAQAFIFLLDHCITLASVPFQSRPIHNPDMPTHVANESKLGLVSLWESQCSLRSARLATALVNSAGSTGFGICI